MQVRLPPKAWAGTVVILPFYLKDYFVSRGVDAYLVGGFLRDTLRGAQTKDFDVALSGDPFILAEDLAKTMGGRYVPLSPAHGLARIVVGRGEDDTRAIDLSSLKGSIEDDLARRDFTIDALALPLSAWEADPPGACVIDPFGGLEDLRHGTIRAVSRSVFTEDPARLVRAVRLAARLSFAIERQTQHLIQQHASLIASVAAERVRDEFLAIIATKRAKVHLALLDELGLLCAIIPELEHTKGVEQPREHYWDVFGHSLEAVDRVERVTRGAGEPPVPRLAPWDERAEGHFSRDAGDGQSRFTMLKVAALLHDIAKPQTKMIDSNGRTRFFGHHTLGAEMSASILRRLRFSARSSQLVCSMVQHHLRPGQMSQGAALPTGRAVHRFFRDVGDAAVDTLYLSLADYLAARGPALSVLDWRRYMGMVSHVLRTGTEQHAPLHRPPLVNGHDIMVSCELEPGPLVGWLLDEVREAEAAGEVRSREEALSWVSRHLENREERSVTLQTDGGSPGQEATERQG